MLTVLCKSQSSWTKISNSKIQPPISIKPDHQTNPDKIWTPPVSHKSLLQIWTLNDFQLNWWKLFRSSHGFKPISKSGKMTAKANAVIKVKLLNKSGTLKIRLIKIKCLNFHRHPLIITQRLKLEYMVSQPL